MVFILSMSKSSKNKPSASSAIDASNEASLPLDFCFRNLDKFEDAIKEPPRSNLKKCPETGKYRTTGVKFAYNQLADYQNLGVALEQLVVDPQSLEWLDMSYNDLTTIDMVLLDYPNLKILYLQGNGIEKLSEIDKLAGLPNLHSLSLQGNPIESIEGYKNYVIGKLPHLKKFNSATITKQDRSCSFYALKGKQKRKGDRAAAS